MMLMLLQIGGMLFYPLIILMGIVFVACLVVKTVREERAQRQSEAMTQMADTEGVWPPPPNKPPA